MNRDDIIRMAKEAHAHHLNWDDDYIEGTERFAALVAAAEGAACAEIVSTCCECCADTIRSRAQCHPDYIIGDHWLQNAYSRICAGDDEAEVMADFGYSRNIKPEQMR